MSGSDAILLGAAVAALATLVWCWPSRDERSVLARYPAASLRGLFVPFSSAWLHSVRPADYGALETVRRRVGVAVSLWLGLFALVWISPQWFAKAPEAPFEAPEVPPVAEVAPTADESPVRVRREVAPRAPVLEVPAPVPEDEPLEEKRSKTRLYGTAKVKAVYEGHDVHGVLVERVAPGSFWDMLGIRSGDVIIEMENDRIDTPAEMIALINALEREELLHLRVRGLDGDERYIEYRVPEE